jgi:formylglycine-generating enzyme required for sulfatase activity
MQPTHSSPFVRFVAFVLAAAAPVVAQWTQVSSTLNPPARSNAASAFDVHRGVTVLFGGYDGTIMPRGDTWEWSGTAWAPSVPAVRPAPRWGHCMAFDVRRRCVVLFGGFDGWSLRDDTWEWDGLIWLPRTLAVRPMARAFASMAYDGARGVCVLFGGQDAAQAVRDDTWEYDGFAWTQRTPATLPAARCRAAMAWDETRREILMFGGGDGATVRGDLWAWNGMAWSQRTFGSGPSPRWDTALAFDGNCGRAVLVGGSDATWAVSEADSWSWDGVAWSQVSTLSPSARHAASVVHDVQRGRIVLFGGRLGTGAFSQDTWQLMPSCSRTMTTVSPAVVGQTAQFRYDYPSSAANLHFCWTLVTPRQVAAFAVPIPGVTSIGLCRVDLFNVLLDPAQLLNNTGTLAIAVPIPNSPAFTGFQFDVQSADLDLSLLALRWADNDLEVTTAPPPVPVANFNVTPQNGLAPLNVQFTDTSTNSPTSWQWDFDNDGVVDSSQKNPSWTYTGSGLFSVRLVATNPGGSGMVTRSNLVFVGPLPSPNPALNMIPIALGTFQMGSTAGNSNEQPVHQVTLSAPFWIGKYEVTQAQYQAVMGNNPSFFQGASATNAPQRPVETVTWNNAVAYCQALTATEQAAGRVPAGYQYRLPTEAEWEYCCRAGTITEWNTGSSLSTSEANFQGALGNVTYPGGQTAVVGSYAPNAVGLHDMHGNVLEWCLDSYALYAPGPVTNPFVTGGASRVVRGGCWVSLFSAAFCRSAYRSLYSPGFTLSSIGFRVVLAPVLVP